MIPKKKKILILTYFKNSEKEIRFTQEDPNKFFELIFFLNHTTKGIVISFFTNRK